jgi:hypothetical protein
VIMKRLRWVLGCGFALSLLMCRSLSRIHLEMTIILILRKTGLLSVRAHCVAMSLVQRVDMVLMMTTGAVMSHGMLLLLRKRMSHILTESLLTAIKHIVILCLHISLVVLLHIIFGVDDLKLLINLRVGIQLDGRSILGAV